MPPPEVHDEGHDSQGGIDPLTAAQLDALTEAINNLSARLGPSAVGGSAGGGTPGSLAPPWWFKGGMNRPDAPDQPPPGSAAAYDAGSPWWNRYTDPASGASPFTYVRSHWRAPRAPRPPVMPSAARVTEAGGGGTAGGGDYPESVYQVAAATGESPDDIAAGLGIRRGRRPRAAGGGASPAAGGAGTGGKPPWWSAYAGMTPDQPEGGDPGRVGGPWWNKYYASAGHAPPASGPGPGWYDAYARMQPDLPYGGDPGREPKGSPWWAKFLTSAGQPIPGPPPPVSGMAAAMGRASNTIFGGSQWIAAAMGLGGSGEAYEGAPWATRAQTPWNRKRRGHPFHWSTTRKFAAFARLRGGKRAGRMAMAGMSAAAQRFAFSGSISSAARVGIMGAAASGGPAVFGVVAMGVAAVKAAEALNNLTAEQLNYNRHLAQASGQMAMIFAVRDVQERMRDREKGDRLAGSAAALVAGEQQTAEQTKEISILWERTKNDVGAAWEGFKAEVLTPLNDMARVINWLREFMDATFGQTPDQDMTMDQWAQEMSAEARAAQKQRRPEWEPPHYR